MPLSRPRAHCYRNANGYLGNLSELLTLAATDRKLVTQQKVWRSG